MQLEFKEYKVRKIVNIHKHVDGPWFWGKYTAHPYIGCRHGCVYCYTRSSKYIGQQNADTFSTQIKIKMNAAERLRLELPRLEKEIISVGDWQLPAEKHYRLSRAMLEVVLEEKFPLFIIERSPYLTQDLDLLVEINEQSWAGVLFSISSLDKDLKLAFEPFSPGVHQRLKAMEQLALKGITVGTAMMPIFPMVGDKKQQIEDLVKATRDHGGICILAGGMTMNGVQAQLTFDAASRFDQGLEARWNVFYGKKPGSKMSFGPSRKYSAGLGLRVRAICEKHALLDRMPRYISPGPLSINKRIAEKLFLKTYDLELEEAVDTRIWAYRRAAWTVDELDESIWKIYLQGGESTLKQLPGIGKSISGQIGKWLQEEKGDDHGKRNPGKSQGDVGEI
ncbi:MAG: hypothetical protein JEZ06_05010 [Anaerolineaceae bacterium]|nr:hypothetical protein [Anaerolineaceae bacterium]